MIEIGYISDKGRCRELNEDALLVLPKEGIFVVADGVGGNNSGELASGETVKCVADYMRRNPISAQTDRRDIRRQMQECVREVNTHVISISREFPENRGMASTLLLCFIKNDKAYFYNIGDSRAYTKRGREVVLLTEDHTYVNTLLNLGVITEEEAKHHEQGNLITRAIGAEENTQGDFYQRKLKDGDIIVLCTDGLYNEIKENKFKELTEENLSMQQLAEKMVEEANSAGGKDNITVVCLKYRKEAANEQ